jgi:glyoxylase-like metal-dependent hydrolase (beta-lactamase superfamily II)
MPSVALGDFRVTLVRDSVYYWDGGAMFGVVPKTLWGRRIAPDEANRIPLAFNCYIIETGAHTILVDTGAGDKPDERARERMKLPPRDRSLPEVLAAEGVDVAAIDIVVNTHLHWDHSGGNTILTPAGAQPAFPRAVYYTQRGEWEHAHARHPRDSVSYIDANYDPLIDAGRMCLIDDDRDVAPGVRLRRVRGHNQDMLIVIAESAGQTFCQFADLIPTAAHVAPTWVAAFDLFPLETIENKFILLNQAVRHQWICGFGHDADIAFARIQPHKDRFETTEEVR